MSGYRFKCRNSKCGYEAHRYFGVEEFEQQQYGSGWACFKCGFPRMGVIKSNALVKDGFKAGYQRNIKKYCETYSEYKAHLKAMGLVEIGYEDLKEQEEENDYARYWDDDEMLKELYDESGINLDGQLIDGLATGEIKI